MYTYEEFKENETLLEGMKTLESYEDDLESLYIPDVEYVHYGEVKRVLQLLVPHQRDIKQKYPLIVYVQGSAWHKQNIYSRLPQLGYISRKGYVIAVVQYRESDIAPFPAQVQDAKVAIRFLRKHADEYDIDVNNVFLWGDSSGGHTALLAGLNENNEFFDNGFYGEYSSHVNGIIDFYGVVDITMEDGFPNTDNHQQSDSPEGYLLGRKDVLKNLDIAKLTNPIIYLDHDIPPILIIHGTKDRTVSFQHSVVLYQALKEKHKDVEFYRLRYADHGGPSFYRDDILDIVIKFVEKHKEAVTK